ncbi:uncharacterized protein LOC120822816 isoform X2 [Gasterosteus aculeatus]
MSEEVNRNKVFKTTRVRTLLKKDGCWIQSQKSNKEKEGARKGHDVETSSVPRHTSVQSLAKKFEPQAPTEEIIQNDTQSEERCANMTADVSAEVHVTEEIQNGEPHEIPSTKRNPEAVSPVQPAEQAVANTTTENKGEQTNKTVEQSNQEHSEAKVSANAHVQDPEAETCVAPAVKPKPKEEPATKTEQDIATQLEHAEVQSTVQLAEGNCMKGPPKQGAGEIVEAKAEVAVAPSPEISDVVDATLVKEVVLQESVEAVAEIVTKSPLNTSNALETTPGNKAALEISVEPVPDLLAEPESEGPSQRVTETAPAGNREKGPPEQAAAEIVKAKAEVAVAPSPEISDVVDATLVKEVVLEESAEAVAEIVTKPSSNTTNALETTPGNKAAVEISVEPVPGLLAEPESEGPSQRVTETAPKGNREKGPPEQAAAEIVKAKAEVAVAPSPEIRDVVDATLVKEVVLEESAEAVAEIVTKPSSNTTNALETTPGNKAALEISVEPVPDLLAEPESEGPSQRVTETAPEGNREKGPPEQATGESVEAAADVAVESSPETPAVTRAAGENAPLPVNVDPVRDIVANTASESLATAAAESAVNPEASGVEAAAAAKPVVKTGPEEVVEHKVQPADNPVIEQSVEPNTERAADHVGELIINESSDEEPPTTEVAAEPLKDPKQSRTEETKRNQPSDDANNSDISKKSKKDSQSTQTQNEKRNSNVCSFCEKIIAGNVKILFSDPAWTCHPDCLKCYVCTKPLGELLTPLFSHDQGVQCDTCFAETLNIET